MTSAVQHRVRTQDGITLAADCYDHEDARRVVLLLHGGGQNRHAWSTSARRLHACGYTVVAYDTRGHGDSDWDPAGRYDLEFTTDELVQHCAGFLGSLGNYVLLQNTGQAATTEAQPHR